MAVLEFFMTISSPKFHKTAAKIICDGKIYLV